MLQGLHEIIRFLLVFLNLYLLVTVLKLIQKGRHWVLVVRLWR